jgi:hypothetical protein
MVRQHSENSKKSAGRKAIKGKWGKAWKEENCKKLDCIFFDSSMTFHAIGQFRGSDPTKEFIPKGKDLKKDVYNIIIKEDENGNPYKTVQDGINKFVTDIKMARDKRSIACTFLCFDKSDYVPIAKAQTQNDRDKALLIENLPPLKLSLNMRLTNDWGNYLAKRGQTRKDMIRFITKHILDPKSPCRLDWNEKDLFFIDGHCLELEDIKDWDFQCNDPDNFLENWKDPTICLNEYPICMQISDGQRIFSFEKRLHNQIGEFDYTCSFLAKTIAKMSEDSLIIEIISKDTDLLYLSIVDIWNSTVQGIPVPKIYIRDDGSLAKDSTVLNVNHLIELIKKDIKTKNAELLLCFIMQIGGCDYIDGHYFITHEKIFNAFLQCIDWIQESMTIEIGKMIWIDFKTYTDFLLHLYTTLHSKKVENYTDLTIKSFNSILQRSGVQSVALIDKYFPCVEDCILSCKQWLFICNMMFLVGDGDIDRLDPLKYGYVKIDESLKVSKTNIKRMIIPEELEKNKGLNGEKRVYNKKHKTVH